MADKRLNREDDEPMTGAADERIRGVADDEDEFEDVDVDDVDDEEEEEESSTF